MRALIATYTYDECGPGPVSRCLSWPLSSAGVAAGPRAEYPRCLTEPNAGNTFAGSSISQAWNDLTLWEEFLNRTPVSSIVELGTWHGGMAIFLALQAAARKARFVTLDSNLGQIENAQLLRALGAQVLARDLLAESSEAALAEILLDLPRPILLFCDNGNKREEVRRFAPLLAEGDYLAIHDWGKEFHQHDLPSGLEHAWPHPPDAGSGLTRWFRVKG